MAFLVRCPCCAAPKRVDPMRDWDAERVECPRCASMYEACAGHGVYTLDRERSAWVRFIGPGPVHILSIRHHESDPTLDLVRIELVA